jgi:hypothetical protein
MKQQAQRIYENVPLLIFWAMTGRLGIAKGHLTSHVRLSTILSGS